jgi:hypothetical protein
MIEEVHFDVDEIMLKENIEIHDINEMHHSFQSFSVQCFIESKNPINIIKRFINSQ